MKFDIKVPAVGESITEATIGSWTKQNGEKVQRNDVLLTLETDKASVEVVAEHEGVLQILAEAGKTIAIGSVIGSIDTEASAMAGSPPPLPKNKNTGSSTAGSSGPLGGAASNPPPLPPSTGAANAMNTNTAASANRAELGTSSLHPDLKNHLPPSVQRIVTETGLQTSGLEGTGRGGRITKEDAMRALQGGGSSATGAGLAPGAGSAASPARSSNTTPVGSGSAGDFVGAQKRVPMTTIRKKIAERLVYSQQSTATLTTFNEIDMSRVMEIRTKYKDKFKERYGLNLGFMGFFVKASIEALKAFPALNGWIDGTDIVYNMHHHIGVAVGTEKGLIVPVIRKAESLSIFQIENQIREFALKARDGKISIDDLSGGTFTISNGGVYGSLMSTPILNPPQSGILGMHKIEDRPMAIQGKVEIRPMMYVALSYDHRIVDGKEAVGFLVKVKEGVEDPERLLLEI